MSMRFNGMKPALYALAMILAPVAKVQAIVIVDSGIDTVTRHYAIDTNTSELSYSSGVLSFDENGNLTSQPTQLGSLAGTFDVEFLHYWWTYQQGGEDPGNQDIYLYTSDWLRFVNPQLTTNGLPSGFQFPGFYSSVFGFSAFVGSNGVCSQPLGPDSSCSGTNTGAISALSGQLLDDKIVFDGHQPTTPTQFTGGYLYHIEASPVPIPNLIWPFAALLAGWTRKNSLKNA
ncbi:hypothetical protein ACH50O_08575 [Methylomonas sp. 2BW1-5-20]|uniref:hypothetical protein n=1 Tax=Methylomonas sp. 2BW1-5-20 TaxID=3376686 RepID=UPI00404CB611